MGVNIVICAAMGSDTHIGTRKVVLLCSVPRGGCDGEMTALAYCDQPSVYLIRVWRDHTLSLSRIRAKMDGESKLGTQ